MMRKDAADADGWGCHSQLAVVMMMSDKGDQHTQLQLVYIMQQLAK